MKIIEGIIWAFLGQILSFYQIQGYYLFEFSKKNIWFPVILGIPVSYMFIKATKAFVEAYNGEIWPSRLIGFGIGVMVFTLLSLIFFKEGLSVKTLLCLILGLGIILIQLFYK